MAKPRALTDAEVKRLRELLRQQSREARQKAARKEFQQLRARLRTRAQHHPLRERHYMSYPSHTTRSTTRTTRKTKAAAAVIASTGILAAGLGLHGHRQRPARWLHRLVAVRCAGHHGLPDRGLALGSSTAEAVVNTANRRQIRNYFATHQGESANSKALPPRCALSASPAHSRCHLLMSRGCTTPWPADGRHYQGPVRPRRTRPLVWRYREE